MSLHNLTTPEPRPFNSPLPSSLLNIEEKRRSNFFPWRGQFSPELIEALLRNYSADGDVVLDPFAGSGTVLMEAGRLSRGAYGIEINPAAAIIARLYEFMNLPLEDRKEVAAGVANHLRRVLYGSSGSLPSADRCIPIELLLQLSAESSSERAGHLVRALIILLDVTAARAIPAQTIWEKWTLLEKRVLSLPYSALPLRVMLGDARKLPFASSSIDFVVTSPPYINVFNYHHNFRGSVEALSWAPLRVAQSEIGSNRKFRGNRFLTVVQYILDMTLVLADIHRVCQEGARVVFIVGRESAVQKTAFFNGQVVGEIANFTGFADVLRQERVFRNKFGASIFEDILHLEPTTTPTDAETLLSAARSLALSVLREALSRVHPDTESALKQALERVDSIEPSPLFRATTALERPPTDATSYSAS